MLDVGTDNSLVRLHQPQKGEKSQYAALSYCWGDGTQRITTTTSNYREHMVELPHILPQTISDAIEVCRKVGIRYLWIDALCIFQDSDDDKLDQIAQMGAIYKNSTVAIVAACAASVTDGFLSNAPEEPVAQLPFFVDSSTSGNVYLRLKDAEMTYDTEEPIFERAWTFQEFLLPPRALVFDSHQIHFKCLEQRLQPIFQTHLEFQFECPDLPISVHGLVDENLARRKSESSKENYKRKVQIGTWARMINEYSRRDMKFYQDRLPALAGVASELAKSWNDTYLAGLWCRTIVEQLGWYRTELPRRNELPTHELQARPWKISYSCPMPACSPSWSWVTVPGAVRIDSVYYPDASLIDWGVDLKSQTSPFGQVTQGFIALEARVLRMSDLGLKFKSWYDTSLNFTSSSTVRLDFGDAKPKLENCRILYLGTGIRYGTSVRIFIAIEKSANGKFRRIGYTKLDLRDNQWETTLSLAEKRVVILE